MTVFEAVFNVLDGLTMLLAILLAFMSIRKDRTSEVSTLTEMRMDIKYIKERLTDYDDMKSRVTSVEESAKSAHKRIDALERRLDDDRR